MELYVVKYNNPRAKAHIANDIKQLCGDKSKAAEITSTRVTLSWLKQNNLPSMLCQKCAIAARKKLTNALAEMPS